MEKQPTCCARLRQGGTPVSSQDVVNLYFDGNILCGLCVAPPRQDRFGKGCERVHGFTEQLSINGSFRIDQPLRSLKRN